jgi:predicted DNA-binding ribbon-helix-helix protein
MHRTQLYFDEILFNQIKQIASSMNMTVSAYIREVLRKELEAQQQKKQPVDFSEFSGMWENQNITQESLRNKAWK